MCEVCYSIHQNDTRTNDQAERDKHGDARDYAGRIRVDFHFEDSHITCTRHWVDKAMEKFSAEVLEKNVRDMTKAEVCVFVCWFFFLFL